MSAEIIAIIGVVIAAVSVVITSMGRMESRLVAKIDTFIFNRQQQGIFRRFSIPPQPPRRSPSTYT